jgi:hypothetical protein
MNDKLFNTYNFLGTNEDYSQDDEEQAVEMDNGEQGEEQDPSQR